jgi:hypothetical protein
MARCFLVLGTPRSGTSLVAGVLSALGVDMGPSPPGNEWNPAGFFQDVEFWALLHRAGNGFKRHAELALLIAKRSRGFDWGVKNPDLAYVFADFVAACTDEIRIVRTTRPHARSVASWQARTHEPQPIDAYAEAIARINPAAFPTIAVDFDALIDNPPEQVTRLAEFCERAVTPEAIAFPQASLRRH